MALRPVGTLSSLTGIVVMAAVFWLLLNFVYAPSCGRFSCSYEPAWLPEAHADFGSCPVDVSSAATSIADRVEAKVAGLMRENGAMSGVLIINHPEGPCPPESARAQPLSSKHFVGDAA